MFYSNIIFKSTVYHIHEFTRLLFSTLSTSQHQNFLFFFYQDPSSGGRVLLLSNASCQQPEQAVFPRNETKCKHQHFVLVSALLSLVPRPEGLNLFLLLRSEKVQFRQNERKCKQQPLFWFTCYCHYFFYKV